MLDVEEVRQRIIELVEQKARFVLSSEEKERIAVVAFGDFFQFGAGAIDTIMHDRYGGRLIIFFPNQVFPEHWHPNVDGNLGKEETFRVLWGKVYSYGEGEPSGDAEARIPPGKGHVFTARKEVILEAGEQRSIGLEERHWFVGGPEGAVAIEISSTVRDRYDRLADDSLTSSNL
ncbi:MAG: D-lyxose/D-mannose family sugar isomerase [Candidatus Limnocylindrales bacterium]|jgi:D-lyxose ketol-isomerase